MWKGTNQKVKWIQLKIRCYFFLLNGYDLMLELLPFYCEETREKWYTIFLSIYSKLGKIKEIYKNIFMPELSLVCFVGRLKVLYR